MTALLQLLTAIAYPPGAWLHTLGLVVVALSLAVLAGLGLAWWWWAEYVWLGAGPYNGTVDESAWVVVNLGLLAGGLALLLRGRPLAWQAGSVLFALLLAAH